MADFCAQCTDELFGPDVDNDLSGIITEQDTAGGFVSSVVICEGCGPIQVDHLGKCVSPDCLGNHAKTSNPK